MGEVLISKIEGTPWKDEGLVVQVNGMNQRNILLDWGLRTNVISKNLCKQLGDKLHPSRFNIKMVQYTHLHVLHY